MTKTEDPIELAKAVIAEWETFECEPDPALEGDACNALKLARALLSHHGELLRIHKAVMNPMDVKQAQDGDTYTVCRVKEFIERAVAYSARPEAELRADLETACRQFDEARADLLAYRRQDKAAHGANVYRGWIKVDDGTDSPWHTDLQEWVKASDLKATHPEAVPSILFDGYAVYSALPRDVKGWTSAENVAVVLDTVVKIMRRDSQLPQREPDGR